MSVHEWNITTMLKDQHPTSELPLKEYTTEPLFPWSTVDEVRLTP